MDLSMNHIKENNTYYLQITGEVDAYTVPDLRDKLMKLTEKKNHTVIVDFAKVVYMDSTGLGVIVGALKATKKSGSQLILKNLTPRVRRLFRITGLDEIVTIENDGVKGEVK